MSIDPESGAESATHRKGGTWPNISILCLLAFTLLVALSACSRTSRPIPDEIVGSPPSTATAIPVAESTPEPRIEGPDHYAVIWLTRGESLAVRETAGITGRVVAEVSSTETRLRRTGRTTRLGSSSWFEVRTPSRVVGWAPAWNVTEYVPSDMFCADPRARELIDEFHRAVRDEDAQRLQSVLNPRRGLVVRIDPWNPEIQIESDETLSVFSDAREVNWGSRYASNTPIQGSFSDVVLPSLQPALEGGEDPMCNALRLGQGAAGQEWPPQYDNLNYYSLMYRPESSSNPYNWRTWAIGIEYVDDQPYITLLVQFRPQA